MTTHPDLDTAALDLNRARRALQDFPPRAILATGYEVQEGDVVVATARLSVADVRSLLNQLESQAAERDAAVALLRRLVEGAGDMRTLHEARAWLKEAEHA